MSALSNSKGLELRLLKNRSLKTHKEISVRCFKFELNNNKPVEKSAYF